MENKAKHTPGQGYRAQSMGFERADLINNMSKMVGTEYASAKDTEVFDDANKCIAVFKDNAEANKFVRACNSRDALLEALKLAHDALEYHKGEPGANLDRKAFDAVSAAIASAEKGA